MRRYALLIAEKINVIFRVLLEVEVMRSHGDATVIPIEATLLESRDSAESPDLPSKLMNLDLEVGNA